MNNVGKMSGKRTVEIVTIGDKLYIKVDGVIKNEVTVLKRPKAI